MATSTTSAGPPARRKKRDAPAPAERPEADRLGTEYGIELNLPFSTPFMSGAYGVIAKSADEELVELLHDQSEQWGPTVRQLIAMRRLDGQARALYRLLTLPIRAALTKATFIPAEDGEDEAEFVEQALTLPPESGGMTVTWQRFMSQVLQGLFDGFCAFEKVFWVPDFGPMAGKVTLKKIAHRPAETVTFITDRAGGFAGIRQRAGTTRGQVVDVFIPREYAFYYAAQEEERKFYGVSFFQSAFYHYDKKVKLYYIAHLAAQRAAVGTRIGTYPLNASQSMKQEFSSSLANLALAQFMMIPETYKVELLKEGGGFDFLAYINHHNSQMSKSILAAFFDKDQGAGRADGSLVNFAAPGDDMFILMLRAVMDDIANQINHYIIPQLIDFNFVGGKYPTFTWGKLTEEQKEAIATTFDKIATNSQNLTPEFIRAIEEYQASEFGLEIDYDEVDQREAEAADAAAQAGATPFSGGDPSAPGAPQPPVVPGAPTPDAGPVPPAAPGAANGDGPTVPNRPQAMPDDQGNTAPVGNGAPAEDEPKKSSPFDASAAARRRASAPPTPPAPPAAPADNAPDPAAPFGLPKDWTIDQFETMLDQAADGTDQSAGNSGDTSSQDSGNDARKNFERNLRLTQTPQGGLIRLAQEMLDQATEELNAS